MDKIVKKIKNLLILSVCVLMMVCMMTGCRQSPALVDNIYTKDATEVDPEQLMSSADQSDETDDLETVQEQKNKQDNQEQAKTAAVQNDQFSDQNQTKNVQGSKNNNSSQASSGETSDNDQAQTGVADGSKTDGSGGVNEGVGTGGEGQNTDGTGTGETIPDTIPDEPIENSESENDSPKADQSGASDANNGDKNSQDETSGGDGNETPSKWDLPRKAVKDASNTEWNIPRDVYTVTAVGAAAPIVEMIGGSGRLMASSASFTQGALANTICQDVINGNVLTWWDDDGTNPISESNFQALMAASPDVCFVVDGQTTFTTEQLTTLQEAGIGYVPLPEMNSLENLKSAVNIVAATLETNETTHEQAKNIAREYSDWIDHIISEVNTNTISGTIVISGWDNSVQLRAYALNVNETYNDTELFPEISFNDSPNGDGTWNKFRSANGAAVGWSPEMSSRTPFAQCMQSAGILVANFQHPDTGYDIPYVSGYEGIYQYYIPTLRPFGSESGGDGTTGRSFVYGNKEVSIGGNSDAMHTITTMIYIGSGSGKTLNPFMELGDPQYPAVIAETVDVKRALEVSSFWKYYSDEQYSTIFDHDRRIRGPYTIYVNPIGFNTWLYGGVDSPLEAIWAACKISGTVSESKLRSEVEGFYEEFFGIVPNYNSIVTQ